jgi:hypothetical protein
MNDAEMDKLLEGALAGPGPRAAFREQVLRASVAAFARRRHRRALWRRVGLSVAALVIAGVSFLLGRCSLPPSAPTVAPVATVTPGAGQTVAVPGELVTWLQAARFFKQLGMPQRVARAYERASALLPEDMATAGRTTGSVLIAADGEIERANKPAAPVGPPGLPRAVESMSRIMAQSFGD